jgi:hypothetical protein
VNVLPGGIADYGVNLEIDKPIQPVDMISSRPACHLGYVGLETP